MALLSLLQDGWSARDEQARELATAPALEASPAPRSELRTSLQAGDPYLVELLSRGTQTSSGTWVTPESALRIAAVYRCVQVIAGGIAMTELPLYRQVEQRLGKQRAYDNPLYTLMHDAPNEWQTSFEFREQLTANALLNGNGYAEIIRRSDGVITDLHPLNPERVRPYRAKDGKIWFEFRPTTGEYRQIAQDEMLHLKAFSRDGVTGLSPIALMRETVGLAQAGEEYQARFFSNDATPPAVLTTPAVLDEEARKRLQQSWMEGGAGLPNAHRVRVLEQGLDIKTVAVSNRDAEFLNLRKYQVVDIARMFGVPPHMLQDLDRATFNNIEHLSLEFVTFCLSPWFNRWQQALARDLMSAKMRAQYFWEFRAEKLVVSDVLQRFQAWNAAIISGWVNRNEVREREGFNPEPGLSVFVEPLNVQPVGAQPAAVKPGAKASAQPVPQDDGQQGSEGPTEQNALLPALRELVAEHVNALLDSETRALRAIAMQHQDAGSRKKEVAKFYRRFGASPQHIVRSQQELQPYIDSGETFGALLDKWELQRAQRALELIESEVAQKLSAAGSNGQQ